MKKIKICIIFCLIMSFVLIIPLNQTNAETIPKAQFKYMYYIYDGVGFYEDEYQFNYGELAIFSIDDWQFDYIESIYIIYDNNTYINCDTYLGQTYTIMYMDYSDSVYVDEIQYFYTSLENGLPDFLSDGIRVNLYTNYTTQSEPSIRPSSYVSTKRYTINSQSVNSWQIYKFIRDNIYQNQYGTNTTLNIQQDYFLYDGLNYYYFDNYIIKLNYTDYLEDVQIEFGDKNNKFINIHLTSYPSQPSNEITNIQTASNITYFVVSDNGLSSDLLTYLYYYNVLTNGITGDTFSQIKIRSSDMSTNGLTIYDEGYQDGLRQVQLNPNEYNLYTSSQYNLESQEQYDNGYQVGFIEGAEDLRNYDNVMTTVFNGAKNILSVEVFPSITIGLIVGLPLLLGLFIVIIKTFRG